MSKPLVVVESPTKVRTIKKYLGNDFNVVATVGHIKDLPQKEMGIDIEDGFKPQYINIPGKQRVISELRKAAGGTSDIYLAPDPDREGEAIAWHTAEILQKKGRAFHRVLFHELTKNGITAAIKTPETLQLPKYEAQQARRILDRLVGYQVSPLLWRKVKGGLSAGRVQSVTVRIICERERAIQAFVPVEYWTITAYLEGEAPPSFTAQLTRKNGEKITIPDEDTAKAILDSLAGKPLIVEKVQKKTTKRNPLPPFTTSKLQQEAIHKLRFSAKKTMMVAQQLYEGIDLGPGEPVGLITYMRTDSTRIAAEAAQDALQLIAQKFGENYSNGIPRYFKNTKKVQDAHEAIRPTSIFYTPDEIARYLSTDQLALYRLIWQRFVASQMKPALIDQNSIVIAAGPYQFNASGSTIKFPGFMALYLSADEEETEGNAHSSEQAVSSFGKTKEKLPDLSEGMSLTLLKYDPKQHFTAPPPRFSEASLVKELEENGIGRPSTYAAILSTIRDKGYVDLVKGYFRPSELGFIVNDLLVASFPDVFNVDFTAKMEDNLDRIESAEIDATNVLKQFYSPFKTELDTATKGMISVKGIGIPSGLPCPQCGAPMNIKLGKNGHFLACSAYPDCRFTRDYTRDEKGHIQIAEQIPDEKTDKICEKCGQPMVIKTGKYGSFLACSGYPECKHTVSLTATSNGQALGISCPEPGCTGELVEKKSKRGKAFYGCSRYPDCKFAMWDKPVGIPCPRCGAKFLVEKSTKKEGVIFKCLTEGCDHTQHP